MRYFFLVYALIALLVIGIFGFRGQHFSKPPYRIFPDMDEQDKLKAQKPDAFFSNGLGSRIPVTETQPRGLNVEGVREIGGIPEYEFGGQTGYYYTGRVGDYFGTGMPEELKLTDEASAAALIHRGKERFQIYCAVCHGASGDGQGMTSQYGVPGIANFHLDTFKAAYPDGRIFETITHGKGMMGAYGYNIPVRDRWAIISYVRTLQTAKESTAKAQ